MAEPNNTPFPTAPPTPRSASPILAMMPQSLSASPIATRTPQQWPPHTITSHPQQPSPQSWQPHIRGASLTVPTYTHGHHQPAPTSAPAVTPATTTTGNGPKPVVLHLGDPVRYHPEMYAELATLFDVVRPETEERERPAFMAALRERRWGDFAAIIRPSWGSGGEMGAWDAELIALLPPSVRIFAAAGAGYESVDVKLLGEKGIPYCNSGQAAADAVADFAVALIIGTFRSLPYCITAAGSGSAEAFTTAHAAITTQSHNLRGRTLGIVGLGQIGRGIAQRCADGFGMNIAYHDVAEQHQITAVPRRYCVTLEALVRASDCVVLCAPPTAGKIIDEHSLRWFRPGARLVNVARGSLVDEDALADALERGALAAVALDVHADEPHVSERLRRFAGSTALLTCHNAGGTIESHAGFEELCARNVLAALSGNGSFTPVNLASLAGWKTT